MVVVRGGTDEAVLCAKVVVFGRVRVAGEAHARPLADQCEELGPVDRVHRRVVRVEIGAQRNVHGRDHQPVGGLLGQQVGDERALAIALALVVVRRMR